jgi:hypothetical protein
MVTASPTLPTPQTRSSNQRAMHGATKSRRNKAAEPQLVFRLLMR